MMYRNHARARCASRIGALARRGAQVCVVAIACVAAACSSTRGMFDSPAPSTATPTDFGQQATLRSIGGSAVSGKIRVVDRGGTASVLVSLINAPGGAFRIAFHETPNCSSSNGFSAGAPWAPASSGKRPQDLVPAQYGNPEAVFTSELRIAGLHATGANGVAGRSVVLYAGSTVPDLRPGVPNEAVACGVFEPAHALTF
jgi:Cu/Zn superoxide dismutase